MSIIGKCYIPEDNSYTGFYDKDGFHETWIDLYEVKCRIVSEVFSEHCEGVGKLVPFVKVTTSDSPMVYRVMWQPCWISLSSRDSEFNLNNMSDDELANIILDAQNILSKR